MMFRSRPAAVCRCGALIAIAVLLFVAPGQASAQTPREIQQQIEALGLQNMTPEQIRQQLTAMGVDASALETFLATRQEEGDARQVSPEAIEALRALMPAQDTTAEGRPREPAEREEETERERAEAALLPDSSALERETGLRVFGLRTFARRSSEFEAVGAGAIPPGYLIGPGDEVVLILSGDVEQQLVLPVTREGFLVIPQAGQVWVNGLTMAELRERLYTVLGRVYSGIGRGPEATVQLQASLGSLRSNRVFVTGEVRRPGGYTTSAVASVLTPLYQAGGPQPTGSFRDVRVVRNGQIVERVDLYEYLTRGSNASDVILQPSDVLFVPPAGPQVAVRGAVTREALYELREGETLLEAIEFAGGLTAPAALGRARITRILPPSQRTEPGVDRTVVDVDLTDVIAGRAPPPQLYDGDEIRIFRVRSELRRIVSVAGAVWKDCVLEQPRRQSEPRQQPVPRVDSVLISGGDTLARTDVERAGRNAAMPVEPPAPCTFHYSPGMRAWDAIEAAEGLRPEAYRQRAQIVRMNPADSTMSILSFSLERDPEGRPLENPPLEEFDALRIFSRADFQDSLAVRLSGEVRRPGGGSFRYRQGMTLEDLLLQAGGLTPEADLVIEVSRRPGAEERRQGQMAEMIQVPVDESYIMSEEGIRFYPGDADVDDRMPGPNAASFVLRPHDQVFVRRVPNLSEGERTIAITGEVLYPGSYALRSKDERLSEIVTRAGGLTTTAFPGGFRLYRNGQLVNVELPSVLRRPGSGDDLIVLPGDSMVVPEYDPVVVVQGAVNSPAAVLYREGAGLEYYIANAGGYSRTADRDNVNVRFANGEGAVRENVLLFNRSPTPGPGSRVNVPIKPADEAFDFVDLLGRVAQIAGTLTTLLLVLDRF